MPKSGKQRAKTKRRKEKQAVAYARGLHMRRLLGQDVSRAPPFDHLPQWAKQQIVEEFKDK